MSFAHPSVIVPVLAAAAIFAALYVHAQRRRTRNTLQYSNLAFLIAAAQPRGWPARLMNGAWVVAVLLVGLALAGPRVHAAIPVHGGSVVLCVDTSGSMAAADVAPTRASAALAAMRAFVDRTPDGTAIGIVSFAGEAQEIVPPTRDREQVRTALEAIPTPDGATAIGDALSLAQRILPKSGHRVVILITDGENNKGIDPVQAAKLLAANHISLYTIGIGTNSGALIPGTLQTAGIDEDALRSYAEITGGAYSRADDAAQLRQALARLGRSTSFEKGTIDFSLQTALAGALLMAITFLGGLAAGRYP